MRHGRANTERSHPAGTSIEHENKTTGIEITISATSSPEQESR